MNKIKQLHIVWIDPVTKQEKREFVPVEFGNEALLAHYKNGHRVIKNIVVEVYKGK